MTRKKCMKVLFWLVSGRFPQAMVRDWVIWLSDAVIGVLAFESLFIRYSHSTYCFAVDLSFFLFSVGAVNGVRYQPQPNHVSARLMVDRTELTIHISQVTFETRVDVFHSIVAQKPLYVAQELCDVRVFEWLLETKCSDKYHLSLCSQTTSSVPAVFNDLECRTFVQLHIDSFVCIH